MEVPGTTVVLLLTNQDLATMEVPGTAVLLPINQDLATTEASGTTAVLLPTNPVPIALGDRFHREEPEKPKN